MALKYDKIIKYKIKAVCDGPLHIGSFDGDKESVLIHSSDRKPFIQATGIAGAFKSVYSKCYGKIESEKIFGSSLMTQGDSEKENSSRVKFSDGIFDEKTLKMELRPHVSIDRKTGSVNSSNGSGQKFDMEYIGVGSEFSMDVYVFDQAFDNYGNEIEKIISKISMGEMLLGAKKSSGAGKIKLKSVLKKCFDMRNEKDRTDWQNEEILEEEKYSDILNRLPQTASKYAYTVKIKGKTEGPLLVKSIASSGFGNDAPDSENIKNARGEYIIPGSSFRGVIRSQMEKICGYMQKESIIGNSFGKENMFGDDGHAGNLIFSDTIVNCKNENENIRHRIHIDKFTGGVFHQGLFSEKNISGDVDIVINITDKNNAEATLAVLLMAVRDLADKTLSVGSGFATGKGFIDVNWISIEAKDKRASITFSDDEVVVTDDTDIIGCAMKTLQEVS